MTFVVLQQRREKDRYKLKVETYLNLIAIAEVSHSLSHSICLIEIG